MVDFNDVEGTDQEKKKIPSKKRTEIKRHKEIIDYPKVRELENKIDTLVMVFGDFQSKLLDSTSILIDNWKQIKNYFRKGERPSQTQAIQNFEKHLHQLLKIEVRK